MSGFGPVFRLREHEALPDSVTHVALVDLDYRIPTGAWWLRGVVERLGDAICWSLVAAEQKRGHGLYRLYADTWSAPDLSAKLTRVDFSDGRAPGVLTGASLFKTTLADYKRATRSERAFKGQPVSAAGGRRK